MSWRLRLGLGEPEELDEEEERELEEPERLEPEELEPLEEPELDPELLLDVELDLGEPSRKGRLRNRKANIGEAVLLADKPAAAASGRCTASFPHFVPSSLLFPVLGNGLVFATVF